eukprot:CAMPEP_0119265666 /NCGR_PEP_ID=MMETSP1329-20130426/4409_1 /TAXON_ID=114041 /ORGANISM="Genus nov. species nov., Strain RCC1024" /LENGTH=346 /DNA_ID=CAMNT_0007265505 /DNA_START=278 /DNA_END=1318 /DNA_ORIENTATION=+
MMLRLDFAAQWRLAGVLALFIALFNEKMTKAFAAWTLKQPWWPRAKEIQRQSLLNFGYPDKPNARFPEGMSQSMILDCWAAVASLVVMHYVEGFLMLPLILAGSWSAASETARDLFILGALTDVGMDVYHQIKIILSTFAGDELLASCGIEKTPMAMFVVLGILHHPLALAMIIPMNVYYYELTEYHQIAFWLLGAAAVCFMFNAYKMTLDVNKRIDFMIFKGCVLFQLVTILYTRVYIWFPNVYMLLGIFKENDDTAFYYGGLVCATLMTAFNLAILNDAVLTSIKWLPKPLPDPETTIPPRELARAMSLGTAATLIPARDGRFKAAANAVIAANRMVARKSKSL